MRQKDMLRHVADKSVRYWVDNAVKHAVSGTAWRLHTSLVAENVQAGDYRLDWSFDGQVVGNTNVDCRIVVDDTLPLFDPDGGGYITIAPVGSWFCESGHRPLQLAAGDHTIGLYFRNNRPIEAIALRRVYVAMYRCCLDLRRI